MHVHSILGCYARPEDEAADKTSIISSQDPVKECRAACTQSRSINDVHAKFSKNPASYFWLSDANTQCNCLPNYPLGGTLNFDIYA